jgi:hypothetical protein
MQLIGRAQQKVSAEVADAFGGMVGESSAARELLDEFLPAPEPDQETQPGKSDVFLPEQEAEDRPPAPPHRPPPSPQPPQQHGQPRRRPRPAPDEDDDESNPW